MLLLFRTNIIFLILFNFCLNNCYLFDKEDTTKKLITTFHTDDDFVGFFIIKNNEIMFYDEYCIFKYEKINLSTQSECLKDSKKCMSIDRKENLFCINEEIRKYNHFISNNNNNVYDKELLKFCSNSYRIINIHTSQNYFIFELNCKNVDDNINGYLNILIEINKNFKISKLIQFKKRNKFNFIKIERTNEFQNQDYTFKDHNNNNTNSLEKRQTQTIFQKIKKEFLNIYYFENINNQLTKIKVDLDLFKIEETLKIGGIDKKYEIIKMIKSDTLNLYYYLVKDKKSKNINLILKKEEEIIFFNTLINNNNNDGKAIRKIEIEFDNKYIIKQSKLNLIQIECINNNEFEINLITYEQTFNYDDSVTEIKKIGNLYTSQNCKSNAYLLNSKFRNYLVVKENLQNNFIEIKIFKL